MGFRGREDGRAATVEALWLKLQICTAELEAFSVRARDGICQCGDYEC